MTGAPALRHRPILGMSAVLLPFTADGAVDWPGFEAHVARTRRGRPRPRGQHGHRATCSSSIADTRARVLGPRPPRAAPPAFVAGAFVADDPGAAFDLDAYLRRDGRDRRVGRHAGDLPVARAQRARPTTTWVGAHAALGRRVDRFIGFELGPMFVPYGRIVLPRRVPSAARSAAAASAPSTRRCRGRPSGTASRCATVCVPTSTCSPATTSPSTWSCYGSDYLLGLSTFAPGGVRRARPALGTRRAIVLRAQRPAAVPRRLRLPGAGPRVPPRRGDVPAAPRSDRLGHDAAGRAPPPRQRPRGPRRHRAALGVVAVTASEIVQVKRLRTIDELRARLAALGIADQLGVDDAVDPQGPAVHAVLVRRRLDRGTHRRQPVRRAADGGLGRHEPTDAPPTSYAAAGAASARAERSSSGVGEAVAVRHDGRANPHQLVLDRSTVDDLAALRADLAGAHVATIGSDDGLVVGLQLTHSGRWSRPDRRVRSRCIAYHHPVLDRRVAADATVLTDDELDELVDAYVDAAVLAADAGFDFVDVKHCHGYLLHELPRRRRPAGRVRRRRSSIGPRSSDAWSTASARAPRPRDRCAPLGVRLRARSAPDADGVGAPVRDAAAVARYAFGGDGTGLGIDLTEAHALPRRCAASSASASCASPRAARTTTRTSSGRRTSRRPTATRRPRIRSSAWPA